MEKLRELREKHKKTQKEMAKILGVSRSAYGQWETGAREPAFETLSKIASILGCTVDYLIGEGTEYAPKKFSPSLTIDEEEIVATYRFLPERHQKTVLSYMRTLRNIVAENQNL